MTDAPIADQSPGANHPPSRFDEILDGANAWITTLPRNDKNEPDILDEDTANKCRDFIQQIETEWSAQEAARVEEKKPHDDAAEAVQVKYRPKLARLVKAKLFLKGGKDDKGNRVSGIISRWLDKEAARLKAEKDAADAEALRVREEAAAKLKAAEEAMATGTGDVIGAQVAADEAAVQAEHAEAAARTAGKAKPKAQGDFAGRAISNRTYHSATVVDLRKATLWYLSQEPVNDLLVRAVQAIADADARTNKEAFKVPGCTLKTETGSS